MLLKFLQFYLNRVTKVSSKPQFFPQNPIPFREALVLLMFFLEPVIKTETQNKLLFSNQAISKHELICLEEQPQLHQCWHRVSPGTQHSDPLT